MQATLRAWLGHYPERTQRHTVQPPAPTASQPAPGCRTRRSYPWRACGQCADTHPPPWPLWGGSFPPAHLRHQCRRLKIPKPASQIKHSSTCVFGGSGRKGAQASMSYARTHARTHARALTHTRLRTHAQTHARSRAHACPHTEQQVCRPLYTYTR